MIAQSGGFVKLKNKDFYKDGKKFYPLVLNYSITIIKDINSNKLYPIPSTSTIGNVDFCFNDNNDFCYNEMVKDFNRIKSAGFNTIRLVGPLALGEPCDILNCSDCCGTGADQNPRATNGTRYLDFLAFYYTDGWNWKALYPVNDKPSREVVLKLIESVLQAAEEAGLKVILLVGDINTDHQRRIDDYCTYLGELSSRFKDCPTLFAYDLYNEPQRSGITNKQMDENGNIISSLGIIDYSKNEICDITTKWYDSIKKNTNNQLITIGVFGKSDLDHWDPFVIKVDFLSLHIYGNSFRDDPYSQIISSNIVKSELMWAKRNLTKPWIIGETGYSSSMVACDNDFGNWNQQLDFASFTLNLCRDCGGSGYSWWIYKDIFYDRQLNCRGSYFGLFTKGITPNIEVNCPTNDSSCSKPVVSAFNEHNFNPNDVDTLNCAFDDEIYYNPKLYNEFIKSGRVLRTHDSLPISVALVQGWNRRFEWDSISLDSIQIWTPFSTVTREDGTFLLKSNLPINTLKVGAKYARTTPIMYDDAIKDTIFIEQPEINQEIDYYLSNINYQLYDQNYFEAWNNIYVDNTTLAGNGVFGSTLVLKAGNSIILNDGFIANNGCTFMASIGNLNIDNCNKLPAKLNINKNVNKNVETKIQENGKGYFSIVPNPTNSTFAIKYLGNHLLVDSAVSEYKLGVYSVSGKLLYLKSGYRIGQSISLPEFRSGIYFITIESDIFIEYFKMIKIE